MHNGIPSLNTRAIMETNTKQYEDVMAKERALQLELETTRNKYKWWKDLFLSQEKQAELLGNIEKKGKLIKEEIALLPSFPTLKELDTENPQEILDTIILMVSWVDENFNVSTDMTESQMEMVAQTIIVKHGSFRLEDVTKCFSNAIRGLYGKNFNRLDPPVVLGWIQQYETDRQQAHIEQQERMHLSTRGNPHDHKGKRLRS